MNRVLMHFTLILLNILFINSFAQSPIKERSLPIDTSKYIGLNMWELQKTPNINDLNHNWEVIDTKLHEFIIDIDSCFFEIVNDTLRFSNLLSGHNCFDSTDIIDSVYIPGLKKETDVVIVTIWDNLPTISDALGVELGTDYFICKRSPGGSNVLYYTWLWIKRH